MARLYLFLGPEIGLKNDEIDSMRSSMKKKAGEIEFHSLYASETKVSEAVDILESNSLFGGVSFVVFHGAESIKKKDDIALLETVSSGSGDNTLVLTSDGWSVDAKLDKIVPKENRRTFKELFAERKEAWIRDFFRRDSLSIEQDAISLILELVENDTESLRSECSRFKWCFSEGSTIKASDVEHILAHNREESAFTLFDAISRPDEEPKTRLENALLILQKIQLTKNASPVLLIAGLATCFRKLSLWHSIHAGGAFVDDFQLKKHGFLGKTICAQYARASRIWGSSQCAAICALLSERDVAMRTEGSVLFSVRLSLLLYEIVIKKGAPIALYDARY